MIESQCICLTEPQPFDQYEEVRFVGIDETNGRFGEVNLKRCKVCGQLWLHYLVEYESFTGSGRYFMGLITPERADALTADSAVDYLNGLDWYLCGGSYFSDRNGRNVGNVDVTR